MNGPYSVPVFSTGGGLILSTLEKLCVYFCLSLLGNAPKCHVPLCEFVLVSPRTRLAFLYFNLSKECRFRGFQHRRRGNRSTPCPVGLNSGKP